MNEPLPPAARLLQITGQVQLARALALTVELGIADSIEAHSQTAPQLAESLDLHPGALYRFLRMLAAEGIFAENPAGKFEPTPLSTVLTRNASGSIRDLVRLPWHPANYKKSITAHMAQH